MERILELYEKQYKEYALAVMEVEIELHKARSVRLSGKLQKYFNSSQNRNTFARIMSKAYQLQEPVTITYICESLDANRSSVSLMVDECVKEGWVSVLRDKNKAWCMATKELHDAMMKYVHWKKRINKSIIGDYYKSLDQLESVLKKAGMTIPDMSYGELDKIEGDHNEYSEI